LAVGNLESINPEHKDTPWELQEPPSTPPSTRGTVHVAQL
jgi:hypothetical protein